MLIVRLKMYPPKILILISQRAVMFSLLLGMNVADFIKILAGGYLPMVIGKAKNWIIILLGKFSDNMAFLTGS